MYTHVLAAMTGIDVHGASGTVGPWPVADVERIVVDAVLTALSGGASPGVTFTVQRQDANGNWVTMYAFTAQTAINTPGARSIGPGLETAVMIPTLIRIAFTTTGTPTTATASISIIGDGNE